MSAASEAELVFVVDVSSFTTAGFLGSTSYKGETLEIEFDDKDKGVFLRSEMASRLKVRKGSALDVIVEEDKSSIAKVEVGGVQKAVKISDAKVYFAVGKEGGAVIRLRKA